MSLLESRLHYKPFEYGWAFEAYDMQQKMHWLPSEVSLAEDVRDWNSRLTKEEKNLIIQILKFFTQGDIDIATAYLNNYIPKFNHLNYVLCCQLLLQVKIIIYTHTLYLMIL